MGRQQSKHLHWISGTISHKHRTSWDKGKHRQTKRQADWQTDKEDIIYLPIHFARFSPEIASPQTYVQAKKHKLLHMHACKNKLKISLWSVFSSIFRAGVIFFTPGKLFILQPGYIRAITTLDLGSCKKKDKLILVSNPYPSHIYIKLCTLLGLGIWAAKSNRQEGKRAKGCK